MFIEKRSLAPLICVVCLAFIVLLAGYGIGTAASKGEDAAKKPAAAQTTVRAFSKDADCASCHKVYAESVKDTKMLMAKHAAITKDCSSCHKEADMAKAHEGVTQAPPKLFRQRRYPNDMCTACHGSYDGLIEKTKSSTAFKTVHNDLINPHKTHVGQVECLNCHKMHKDRPPIEYCYGCHHPRQLSNCKDCHSPKKE